MKALRKRVGWPRWRRLARRPAATRATARAHRKSAARTAGWPVPAPSQAIRPKPRPERVVKAMIDGAGCIRGGRGSGRASRESRPAASRQRVEEGGEDVDVALARGQVAVDRAGGLLGHELDAAAVGDEAGDRAGGVGEVAEVAGAGRAGADAGGDAVDLGKLSVINAIDAEGALLHHALGGVHLAGAVGAGPGAEAAADAVGLVDQDDAVGGALEAGAGGADGDARRVGAVQAGLREVDDAGGAGVRNGLEAVDAVEESAFGVGAVGVAVGERGEGAFAGVPLLAGDDAGVAADAGVEVDDEAEGPFRSMRQGWSCRCPDNSDRACTIHARPWTSMPRMWLDSSRACHLAEGRFGRALADRRGLRREVRRRGVRAGTRSRRTRRSYQAAWPVTGSELERPAVAGAGGRGSGG